MEIYVFAFVVGIITSYIVIGFYIRNRTIKGRVKKMCKEIDAILNRERNL